MVVINNPTSWRRVNYVIQKTRMLVNEMMHDTYANPSVHNLEFVILNTLRNERVWTFPASGSTRADLSIESLIMYNIHQSHPNSNSHARSQFPICWWQQIILQGLKRTNCELLEIMYLHQQFLAFRYFSPSFLSSYRH